MNKVLKIIRLLIDAIINIVMIVGIAIVLLWLFWDVTPQTSITKAAYFFSESWRIILGRQKDEDRVPAVGKQQLEEAKKHIHHYSAP